ncbi:hypothetical protein AArcSl_0303 [Halalkaliarchaeum desulfuricum]|uniref:Secreted glycoprotein n=1 Tax=Halalkaliarchaeum desulfuricum TaxID=2055893 RepID=A0A343TFT6_9EURY|nr:hypothetical protein [Halalkaliarchaeum desulfuricum]AUX07958.1 hypothetical protein AArcSl_0303 [Halalkaliarchaeum desulfuricum]
MSDAHTRPTGEKNRSRDRALSTTVNYVLALAITSILISGLLIAGSGYMESQRTIAVGNALEVQNEQLADSIGEIDRLAATIEDDEGEAAIRVNLLDRVIDRSYEIAVVNETGTDDLRYTYRLEATSGDVERDTLVKTSTPIQETSIRGGSTVIHYDTEIGDPVLVIESDDGL